MYLRYDFTRSKSRHLFARRGVIYRSKASEVSAFRIPYRFKVWLKTRPTPDNDRTKKREAWRVPIISLLGVEKGGRGGYERGESSKKGIAPDTTWFSVHYRQAYDF